jgi:hypothetical protein
MRFLQAPTKPLVRPHRMSFLGIMENSLGLGRWMKSAPVTQGLTWQALRS